VVSGDEWRHLASRGGCSRGMRLRGREMWGIREVSGEQWEGWWGISRPDYQKFFQYEVNGLEY